MVDNGYKTKGFAPKVQDVFKKVLLNGALHKTFEGMSVGQFEEIKQIPLSN